MGLPWYSTGIILNYPLFVQFTAKLAKRYSSQECSVCHYVDRANRPDQQTFCGQVCGYKAHADLNAASNMARRVGNVELQACQGRQVIKTLLMQRHHEWRKQHAWP